MKLEFVKESPELEEFVKSLKWKDSINFEGDLDDYHTFDAIYYRESSGKHYRVEMRRGDGVYSIAQFVAYHRDFKKSEPYVVTFYEVESIEVVRTEWVDIV